MTIAYISHSDCLSHDMGRHPECPERLQAINDRLIASGLDRVLRRYDAPLIDRGLLELPHDPLFVDRVYAMSPSEGLVWLDGDTAMNPCSLQAALRAAGAVQLGVDLVMQGDASQVFCAVRPPGHHAERNKAMGFCFFNNVAVGAFHALQNHGLERVAIVDFDVHHGNGTEDIVSGDDREAVHRDWLPRLKAFEPELILVSAGFDAHQADDMAGLKLVEEDYAWVTRRLCEQAGNSAGGRLVSSLEGGYELRSLALSVEAHIKAFPSEE